jgi:hypothetical protein
VVTSCTTWFNVLSITYIQNAHPKFWICTKTIMCVRHKRHCFGPPLQRPITKCHGCHDALHRTCPVDTQVTAALLHTDHFGAPVSFLFKKTGLLHDISQTATDTSEYAAFRHVYVSFHHAYHTSLHGGKYLSFAGTPRGCGTTQRHLSILCTDTPRLTQ